MKTKLLIIFTVFLAPLCVQYSFAETKVGIILPMSGDFARYGDKVRQGLESQSFPPGVKLIYEDEGCHPKTATTAYHKLRSADGIHLFIGPWCGSPQTVVANLMKRSDAVSILGSSAPRRVFELSGGRMFAVQHSIEEESAFNARESFSLGARKVVIVFLENDFSRAHEAAFREHFKGEVLETLTYSTPDPSALRALVTKVKQLGPDTLYVPDAFPLMHGLLRNLSALGLGKLRVLSVYSAQSDDVLSAVGTAGEGLFLSYPLIEEEALLYFPKLAAQVLNAGLSNCPSSESACVIQAMRSQFKFDEYGVLGGELGLKIIKDGKFTWYQR